jgi:hypothetical protein
LVSEAHRIRLAHLFDPVLAVHTSQVDPLPHQIIAVYEEMLPLQREPDFGVTSVNYNFAELLARAEAPR